MGFISYAQNYEDVILRRALKNVDKGFYIDVGACDPDFLSVTKTFYMEGWSGINIEPIQAEYNKLCKERPRDITLQTVAGSTKGEVTIWQTKTAGLASTNESAIDNLKKDGWEGEPVKVKCTTLNEICDEHVKEQVHFMKIDVEGSEKDVLLGLDLQKNRPWIILLEALEPLTLVKNHNGWEHILTSNNYFFVYFDGLNRYYLADEHRDLQSAFELPPNVFDDFIHYSTHDAQVKLAKFQSEIDELNSLRKKIKKIRRSGSWRLTYPFRLVKKILIKTFKFLFSKKKLTKFTKYLVLQLPAQFKYFIYWLKSSKDETKVKNNIYSTKTVNNDIKVGNIYYYVNHTADHPANTGIQRVTRGFAKSLMASGVKMIPVKWSGKKCKFYSASVLDKINLSQWNGPDPICWTKWQPISSVGENDWLFVPELANQQTKEIRELAKVSGLKCAWIFYDAIPWKRPDIYSNKAALAHKKFMEAINDCEKIFAISKYSHDDMLKYYKEWGVNSIGLDQRLSVASLPGEFLECERKSQGSNVISKEHVSILCVGTIDERKNQLNLISAIKKLCMDSHIPIKLILAGISYDQDLADKVRGLISTMPQVQWFSNVNDEKLMQLYNECHFTVFPSVEEGFGLPILESLWNAKPCICADFGSMLEVSNGGGCLTTDVTNVDKLCEAIKRLIEEDSLLERLTQEAMNRDFKTWDQYANEILYSLESYNAFDKEEKHEEAIVF